MPLQFGVKRVAGERVGKHHRLDLDAIGNDAAASAVRMDGIFVVRRYVKVAPVSELLFQRQAALLKRVKGHEVSPRFEERTSANRTSASLLPALTKDARSPSPRVSSIVKCYRATLGRCL